jgi:hypothetical protein
MIGCAVAAVAAVSGFAVAQREPARVEPANPDILLEGLNQGSTIEQYVAQQVGTLRLADRAGDGLDRDDVELTRDKQEAQTRAHSIGQALAFDLDGDLRVTREEIERSATGEPNEHERWVAGRLDQFDADGDFVITLAEAAAVAHEPYQYRQLEALLALDPNGDGRLTADELRRLSEQTFAQVDRDQDGRISAGEHQAIAERVQEVRLIRTARSCALPPVSERASLVAYGGYEGDAISSVAVGGPDQDTHLIDVTIEPGSQPLYLVLTSYESMIWRLTGATDRVEQVVVSSSAAVTRRPAPAQGGEAGRIARPDPAYGGGGTVSASGVIGIAAGKVTIAPSGCPRYFNSTKGGEATQAVASLQRSLGRAPDGLFGAYSAKSVSLPSGQIAEAGEGDAPLPSGFDPEIWREAVRFWPGGLVTVDPRRVVAAARVEPYKVLPSQMGLAQLIGSGAIERKENSTIFRLVRPIPRMPPRMNGAHSIKLIVAKGVPLPPGSAGHSCVLLEDSGQSAETVCR